MAESCSIVLSIKPMENLSLDQVHIGSDFSHQKDIKVALVSKTQRTLVTWRTVEEAKHTNMVTQYFALKYRAATA